MDAFSSIKNAPSEQAADSLIRAVSSLRLAELRKHAGLTRSELAAAIGVKAGTIFGYENGAIANPAEQLCALALALHCEEHDLLMAPGAPLPKLCFHRRETNALVRRWNELRLKYLHGKDDGKCADRC